MMTSTLTTSDEAMPVFSVDNIIRRKIFLRMKRTGKPGLTDDDNVIIVVKYSKSKYFCLSSNAGSVVVVDRNEGCIITVYMLVSSLRS